MYYRTYTLLADGLLNSFYYPLSFGIDYTFIISLSSWLDIKLHSFLLSTPPPPPPPPSSSSCLHIELLLLCVRCITFKYSSSSGYGSAHYWNASSSPSSRGVYVIISFQSVMLCSNSPLLPGVEMCGWSVTWEVHSCHLLTLSV